MSPDTERAETVCQTGPGSPHSSGQEGVKGDRSTGEDDWGRAVIERPEGRRVQAEGAELAGRGVEGLVRALPTSGAREGGAAEL